MKKLLLVLMFILVSCGGKDKVKVIHNGDRIRLLEARMALNEANDSLLEARVSSLESRTTQVESSLVILDNSLSNYVASTEVAIEALQEQDQVLADSISSQASQIQQLIQNIGQLESTDSDLQEQINQARSRISQLEGEVQAARGTYPNLSTRLNAMSSSLSNISGSVSSLQYNVSSLNNFRALQTIINSMVAIRLNQLDNKIEQNTQDISQLTSEVSSLTSVVNNISSTYVSQNSFNSAISNLQSQIDNIQTIPGQDGKSAYQLAQEAGFTGSVTDWLASLKGPKGDQGEVGATGPQGQQGIQGIPGLSGSSSGVSAVKLCAGDNATYPEYGFVIGGSLYAVYYGTVDNKLSAFLARLTTGTYQTSNDNSPCTFTVLESNGTTLLNGNAISTPNTNQGSLTFVEVVSRSNGMNNNASVRVRFKNENSFTVSRFSITIATTGNSYVRSGSSLSGPYGTVETISSLKLEATVTSSPYVAPGAYVEVTILMDDLTGSDNLNFTTNIL